MPDEMALDWRVMTQVLVCAHNWWEPLKFTHPDIHLKQCRLCWTNWEEGTEPRIVIGRIE